MQLRHITELDVPVIASWFDEDPSIYEQLGWKEPVGESAELIAILVANVRNPWSYWVGGDRDGELIGVTWADSINPHVGAATVHALVAPQHRGRGLALIRRAIRHAFDDLGLQRLIALIPEGNHRALRFWSALGFRDTQYRAMMLNREGDDGD